MTYNFLIINSFGGSRVFSSQADTFDNALIDLNNNLSVGEYAQLSSITL